VYVEDSPNRDAPGDESATANPRRGRRWTLQDGVAKVSSLERVRKCRRCTHGDTFTLQMHGDRASWGGLQTCGSVWACPLCSASIWAQRQTELEQAARAHEATGGRVVFLTLTMAHKKGDPLPDLWDAAGHAWRAAMGGSNRVARRAMKAAGANDWLRAVEVTHGVNSWHVHIHALLFVRGDITEAGAQTLGNAMFRAWASSLAKKGYRPIRDRGGLDVQLVALDGAADALADYFTKATYNGEAAAAEVAGQHGKSARGANRTPWDILEALIENGEARDFALWREYEQASKGRRALTWSQGTRDRLLGDVEQTDEEVAASSDNLGEVVAVLPSSSWPTIRDAPGVPAMILDVVEAVPPAGRRLALDVILHALGLPPSLSPPPRTDTT